MRTAISCSHPPLHLYVFQPGRIQELLVKHLVKVKVVPDVAYTESDVRRNAILLWTGASLCWIMGEVIFARASVSRDVLSSFVYFSCSNQCAALE
jgi:hypothetical protein